MRKLELEQLERDRIREAKRKRIEEHKRQLAQTRSQPAVDLWADDESSDSLPSSQQSSTIATAAVTRTATHTLFGKRPGACWYWGQEKPDSHKAAQTNDTVELSFQDLIQHNTHKKGISRHTNPRRDPKLAFTDDWVEACMATNATSRNAGTMATRKNGAQTRRSRSKRADSDRTRRSAWNAGTGQQRSAALAKHSLGKQQRMHSSSRSDYSSQRKERWAATNKLGRTYDI